VFLLPQSTDTLPEKKADPGVPNSFHLKDQVLSEMAEERRQAAEARLNKKKKGVVEEEEDAPGISSVGGSAVLARAPLSATASLPVDSDDSDDDVPVLLDSDLPTLQAALDAADILLEVVDARDIMGGRSAAVETLVSEADGLVFIVVNKADLVPREALEGWIAHLPFPTFLFSAPTALGREELLGALAAAAEAKDGEPLKAALLGLPNVGKTSVINALLGKDLLKAAPAVTSAAAAKNPMPTTTACREVEVALPKGGAVHLIDTPGWEYVPDEDSDDEEDDEDLEANIKETEEMDEDDEEEDELDELDQDEFDEDAEDKWDALEARVAGDLLRRNLGRVDRVKDVFPLGELTSYDPQLTPSQSTTLSRAQRRRT
jgi:nuclear GTP-binding protein